MMSEQETAVALVAPKENTAAEAAPKLAGEKRQSKGAQIAYTVAEYVLFKHFFPEIRDKKRQVREKDLFMRDMQYNITKG